VTEPASLDILDRLFIELVRAVRRERPELLAAGMDVAELLRFVPYKAVRARIGADTHDDYGHAMTRLLAGDGGYVFADELMQDDLRAELDSKNPDLQAYRSYLNTKLSLAQARVRATLDALGPAVATTAAGADGAVSAAKAVATRAAGADGAPNAAKAVATRAAGADGAPNAAKAAPRAAVPEPASQPRVVKPITPKAPPLPDPTSTVAADVGAKLARPGCRYCGQPLPQGREVRFCPHCGQDLTVRRCGACSAELDPGWKFCIACGRATTG
jgi:hypothetical protein